MDVAFQDPRVEAVYAAWPDAVRERVLDLRRLVFELADELECGPIEESLRWGEPAYLTSVSRSGTTVRFDSKDPASGTYALYVHCQTDLVSRWRERHGDVLTCEGSRAVVFHVDQQPPEEVLRDCIASALTYKWRR